MSDAASPGGGATAPSPTGSQAARPPAEAPNVLAQDVPSQPQGSRLTADEERELGELLAKRGQPTAGETVRMRVEGPHESVRVGHTTVGREWTEVPAHMVAALYEGAADAGVTIKEES